MSNHHQRLLALAFLAWGIALSASFAAAEELVRFPAPWTSVYRADPAYPYQLVNEEGQHLFLLNKTAWAYFACTNPQGVLDRAKEQGVNVLRVALEGEPYRDVLDLEMRPWGGTRDEPVWTVWNEAYWQEVEARIRLAGEQGIGFDVVLYFTFHPKAEEIEAQKPYWQEAIRRLGKYANVLTWEIMNEHTENEAFQDAAGAYLKEHDPRRRPVCSSDGTTDDALWPHKPWMDLAIVHTCTGSQYDLNNWYLSVARNTRSYGKPAFNNESGREKRHQNDDPVHRRKQGWLWCAAGGFWTWHSWDGCEGIDDTDYRAPGAEFLRPMAEFFRSVPFWTLGPNYTAFSVSGADLVQAVLADAERSLIVAYVCTKDSGESIEGKQADVQLPNGPYTVSYRNPATLEVLREEKYEMKGIGDTQTVSLSSFRDDLLVVIEKIGEQERGEMPGTQ